jgi:hypothetical protein
MYKRIVLLKSPDTAALSVLLQELHGFPGMFPALCRWKSLPTVATVPLALTRVSFDLYR